MMKKMTSLRPLASRYAARSVALSAAISASISLSACGAFMHTPYVTPATTVPPQWQQDTSTATALTADQWWQQFGDTQLNQLIDEVLRRNNDLAAASIKVRRAQLSAGLAADQRLPVLSANLSSSNNRNLRGNASPYGSSSANITLSYEADLWGRLGSQYDAKKWEAQATVEDRESTALTLIGTTANLYWQSAYLNQRVALSAQSIAYAAKTQELVRVQYQAGAVSSLEVLEAAQNLAAQQASHTELLQQQTETANALALLFDNPPGQHYAVPNSLSSRPLPTLQAGIPAQLLRRRPDLRAAELRLRESLATVDATRASYYPTLTLTAAAGGSSSALRDVLQNPIATLGAGLILPFLQWNQMQLNIKVSQADYELAVVTFRSTLYAALSDVENALSASRQYAAQTLLLEQNLQAAQAAERLYEVRYRSGYVALKSWLDAQEKRRTAENTLAQNRLNALKNQVTLYQALGGDMRGTAEKTASTQ